MIKINKFGKISCLFGVPAFIFCLLAEHSRRYLLLDPDNNLLSTLVNILLIPINYIEREIFTEEIPTEPVLAPLGTSHVFEHEAMYIFFTVGILFSLIALYFTVKAAKIREFSIWYTNGAITSILALSITNILVGMVAAIGGTYIILKVRKMEI